MQWRHASAIGFFGRIRPSFEQEHQDFWTSVMLTCHMKGELAAETHTPHRAQQGDGGCVHTTLALLLDDLRCLLMLLGATSAETR